MGEDGFRLVVRGLVTHTEGVLIVKKKEEEGNPVSGQWHFPGGHVESGEGLEDALEREIREEAGLEVEVHQLVDAFNVDGEVIGVFYHCEADSRDAEAGESVDDLEWVDAGDLEDSVGEVEEKHISERERLRNFIEKLKKMPNIG